MATCLRKSCSFGLLCVSFMTICMCFSFPFVFEDRVLDLIVLIPVHCLIFYSDLKTAELIYSR